MSVHTQFTTRFAEEEKALLEELDNSERLKVMHKREQEELKKMEKGLKKEKNDMEDIGGAGATNVKAVHDKFIRTLNNMRKITKELNRCKNESLIAQSNIEASKQAVQSSLKRKNMLALICDQLMKQNFDLYLEHERMLDSEKEQREALAAKFQGKMNELTGELNENKLDRQKNLEKNQEIRNKIKKALDDYKEKEEHYKKKMEEFNKEIGEVQANLQHELKEGSIGQTIKECDKEKAAYDK